MLSTSRKLLLGDIAMLLAGDNTKSLGDGSTALFVGRSTTDMDAIHGTGTS